MNSADLPKSAWKDPALVYAEAEARTCAGCGWIINREITPAHAVESEFVSSCGKRRLFGKRCADYLEATDGK